MNQTFKQKIGSAHPRSRGEHETLLNFIFAPLGSSPLARGTSWMTLGEEDPYRLIPARAGNICDTRQKDTHNTAHPRSRGEHHN